MDIWEKIKGLIIQPMDNGDDEGVGDSGNPSMTLDSKPESRNRQFLLDAIHKHFLASMKEETTTVSLLFHTCFSVYVSKVFYDKFHESFPQTSGDAVTLFMREIKKKLKDYPEYVPHTKFWRFHLIMVDENAKLVGVENSNDEDFLCVVSRLVAPEEQGSGAPTQGRVVTTMRTKNSMQQLPSNFNLLALEGLTTLAKDMYRIEFNLNVAKRAESAAASSSSAAVSYNPGVPAAPAQAGAVATLRADDGTFLVNGVPATTFVMQADSLSITGKNGMTGSNEPVLRVNSDYVHTPHCRIVRDAQSGSFSITTTGMLRLNEILLQPNTTKLLPNNSTIVIGNDIQITFKIK